MTLNLMGNNIRMKIIFCSDPLQSSIPDYDYKKEYDTAKALGFEVYLVGLEDLLCFDSPERAIKTVPFQKEPACAVYRGWMLKPAIYAMFYNALLSKNIRLINSPENYRRCHYFPESYEIIKESTAKSLWFKKDQINNEMESVLQKVVEAFGTCPIIIKDYVKSRKHEWADACYVPNASDIANLKRVLTNFLQRQGDELNEGVVFREFLRLAFLAHHSKSKMPLTREFRLFFYNGQLMQVMYYWDEGDYSDSWPLIAPFIEIARKIKSSFFTMDIAQTEDGYWKIIELGDGQVSGLPDNANLQEFYAHMKQF